MRREERIYDNQAISPSTHQVRISMAIVPAVMPNNIQLNFRKFQWYANINYLRKLLTELELGYQRPTQLLRYMRTPPPKKVNEYGQTTGLIFLIVTGVDVSVYPKRFLKTCGQSVNFHCSQRMVLSLQPLENNFCV